MPRHRRTMGSAGREGEIMWAPPGPGHDAGPRHTARARRAAGPPGRQPRCPAHDMSQPGQETGPRTSSSGSPGTTERAGPHHIASETRKLHPREQPTRPPTRPTALRDTAAGKPVARNCGAPGSGRCAAARQAARSRRRESCSLLLQLNSEGTLLIRASQGCSLGSARSVRQWSR